MKCDHVMKIRDIVPLIDDKWSTVRIYIIIPIWPDSWAMQPWHDIKTVGEKQQK